MSADVDGLLAPNDPRAFEQLCQHVLEHRCNTLWGQAYARSGYSQDGVDFYIEIPAQSIKRGRANTQVIGVQCKYKDRSYGGNLTVDELDAEIQKAKKFRPSLTTYIVATSAPTSKLVQDHAREITRSHRRSSQPLFSVTVWFWEKIRHEFSKDEVLLQEIAWRFYPHLRAAFNSTLKLYAQLPPIPQHIISRPGLMAEIRKAFSFKRPKGAIRAVALVADGGFGKSIAALQYTNLPEGTYLGGCYLVRCGDEEIANGLAALASQSDIVRRQAPEDIAYEVKRAFETRPSCLLILDNVNWEQWTSAAFRSLIPLGQTDILVTTRAREFADVREVNVASLSLEESIGVLTSFRRDAGEEQNRQHIQSLAIEVDGVPVAIAAIGAYMKLTPRASWSGFASAVKQGSVGLVHETDPRVAAQLSYRRSVIEVLDAAVNSLPATHRRALEYAALLPADTVPTSWLVSLLQRDPDIRLAPKPGVSASPASVVIDELAELTLVRPTADGELCAQVRANDLQSESTRSPNDLESVMELEVYGQSQSKGPMLGVHRMHRRRLLERLDNRQILVGNVAPFAREFEHTQQHQFIKNAIRRYGKHPADSNPDASSLGQLEFLGFTFEPITDVGAGLIADSATGCKSLTELNLFHSKLTSAGIIALTAPDTALKGLQRLFVASARIGDAAAVALAARNSGLKNLQNLGLVDVQLTDVGVIALAANDSGLKRLTTLALSSNRITSTGAAALAASDTGLRGLKHLLLVGPNVTDAIVAALATPHSGLRGLTDLDLMGSMVSDVGVSALAAPETGLPNLTSLNLPMTKVTDLGAMVIAHKSTGLTKLTALNLNGTMVTAAGVAAIRNRLPNCDLRYSE